MLKSHRHLRRRERAHAGSKRGDCLPTQTGCLRK